MDVIGGRETSTTTQWPRAAILRVVRRMSDRRFSLYRSEVLASPGGPSTVVRNAVSVIVCASTLLAHHELFGLFVPVNFQLPLEFQLFLPVPIELGLIVGKTLAPAGLRFENLRQCGQALSANCNQLEIVAPTRV